MLIAAVSQLLHDYSYLLLLLSIGVLGFSAGLLRAPLIPSCEDTEPPIATPAQRAAEYRTGKHLRSRAPRMQRDKGEKLSMNTSKDDQGVDSMQKKKMQVKQEKVKKEEQGSKQRIAQDSSSRPHGWLRSLSLGRPHSNNVNEQDSNPSLASAREEKGVQRKASLTGEEVKVLADVFIERVRQRMRAQRQESLKLHPHSQVSFEAPPLP